MAEGEEGEKAARESVGGSHGITLPAKESGADAGGLTITLARMDLWSQIAERRRDLADFLSTLSDADWETPSLCAGWRVHDVVAHLTVPFHTTMPKVMLTAVRARGINPALDRLSRARAAAVPPAELVADLRANAEHHFAPPGLGAVAPLTDVYVHTGDIRRPLGRRGAMPQETTREVLAFLSGGKTRGFVKKGRLDGLAFVATDVDWKSESGGAEIRGPGDALAMAIAGRGAVLDELEGDGVAMLRDRLAR